jgi:hypothetical protein
MMRFLKAISKIPYYLLLTVEFIFKKLAFRCHMCGQCVLQFTGFTCPMRCPKQLRDGPCGGTRENLHCEVYPERKCIWAMIYSRSRFLGRTRKLDVIQFTIDWRLADTSAWVNYFSGRDGQREFKRGLRRQAVAVAAEKS